MSRALPEIDGFKPAHRKLLYTMYEMGLLKGARTKSANSRGQHHAPESHGDAAIYDTMVRMGRGNESLLMPFVDSKGNFGKAYSRDMSCAAARYTEAKLENVCEELFRDIDKDTVDFVPNYDGTTTEPTLLPVTFPTILANNTLGIAVGMACNICSFNLAELCATTVALMKDPHHDIATTMPAPDFVGGGQILYDEAQMREIYEHGRGSVKVRARYNVVPGENMIEITQIPPTTTVEAIMDKIAELVKAGKIKEISDMRDETDLNGLKLTLDLKRGVDADKLMAKLFKTTPLEDSFSANFNILVAGQPRVMGVREILQEWTAFRVECVRRRTYYDLHGKEKRLHLLQGLAAILLDIDKAIKIIRTTEEESEVVPNLMIGFGIDEVQADYVAEIKLRHLNREYILKRTSEIEQLEKDIADLNDVLAKPARVRRIIINELNEVAKKYAQPRRSEILYDLPEEEAAAEEETVPDYPVTVFFTFTPVMASPLFTNSTAGEFFASVNVSISPARFVSFVVISLPLCVMGMMERFVLWPPNCMRSCFHEMPPSKVSHCELSSAPSAMICTRAGSPALSPPSSMSFASASGLSAMPSCTWIQLPGAAISPPDSAVSPPNTPIFSSSTTLLPAFAAVMPPRSRHRRRPPLRHRPMREARSARA